MHYSVYPEAGDETVRFSALDNFMAKYRDSRVVVVKDGEEFPITRVSFFDGRLILHTDDK